MGGVYAGERTYFRCDQNLQPCNRVAVLRPTPEMVMGASETAGYCSASEYGVRTVARAVKLPNFAQNLNRSHRTPIFVKTLSRKDFIWADLAQRT